MNGRITGYDGGIEDFREFSRIFENSRLLEDGRGPLEMLRRNGGTWLGLDEMMPLVGLDERMPLAGL